MVQIMKVMKDKKNNSNYELWKIMKDKKNNSNYESYEK
jgi:hypothetical protein